MLANSEGNLTADAPFPSPISLREDFAKSRILQQESHAIIPGGCHTYAKGDDQFPVLAPGFIARGKGCRVWDVDDNEYVEYGMGCRAVTLGHAYPSVVNAAYQTMLEGSNFARPAPIEVECAAELKKLIDGTDMVKFAKDGSSVTTAAVKLARAFTGRDHVGLCSDHPFFSTADWFIGTTAFDAGIPQVVKDLTLTFRYNDIDSLKSLFDERPNEIACIILEAAKYEDPQDDFLHKVKDLCHERGALLIIDEMITGFRWHLGGAQGYYGITGDLSAFGKALANGFSVSALAGRKDIMELGGLLHDRQRVFLLSTTHGAETHCLAAALETMRVYQSEPVIETLYRQGQRLADGIRAAVHQQGLDDYVEVLGKPCCMVLVTRDQQKQSSQGFRTLLLQETIKRGVLMPSLVVNYSHTDSDIDFTIDAISQSLEVYRKALQDGFEKYLVGRPSKIVYRKFN